MTRLLRPASSALVFAVGLSLLLTPAAQAHGAGSELFRRAERITMPSTDAPPSIDGTIQGGEYSSFGGWGEGGFQLFLAHNDSAIFIGIHQPGYGWVAIAVSSDIDAGANVVVATLNRTGAEISDNFAPNVTDEMVNVPDTSMGGTPDLLGFSAANGSNGATYEFAIPLESLDPRDQRLEVGVIYPFVAAFNKTAQGLPAALADGDLHFLQLYVARASDDLAAIRDMFTENPSPVPALAAMAVLSFTTGALVWRELADRKEDPA